MNVTKSLVSMGEIVQIYSMISSVLAPLGGQEKHAMKRWIFAQIIFATMMLLATILWMDSTVSKSMVYNFICKIQIKSFKIFRKYRVSKNLTLRKIAN